MNDDIKRSVQPSVEYIFPKLSNKIMVYIIIIIQKAGSLSGGIFIAWLLYNKCLFFPLSHNNPIVVTLFSILGLSCFESFGVPITKSPFNIKL